MVLYCVGTEGFTLSRVPLEPVTPQNSMLVTVILWYQNVYINILYLSVFGMSFETSQTIANIQAEQMFVVCTEMHSVKWSRTMQFGLFWKFPVMSLMSNILIIKNNWYGGTD